MKNNQYFAQLHLHTSNTSACGSSTGGEMARACRNAGYDVVVITDHFMNANIACPPSMSWREKVHFLFAGYREAKAVGDRIGLTVLKGWETCNDGPDYLTYGLDESFLLDNPDIARVSGDEYLRRVREAGAFVCHAHPYRQAPYIPPFVPDHAHVDAFEVINASHEDVSWDQRALATAMEHDLIMLAGSDAHNVREVYGGGMLLPDKPYDIDDLIAMLRARECKMVPSMLMV
ncbi:PHP domain-containing protein [Eubacteriales bacterium OttesenSCG-928-N13]|nr:PHP domain-containing protein [Eubacteriales bacterium OttesenSCG-928-N13]